ncbi:MAG: imidazolonepropionase, partial [Cyclobacteriaceae bacterium]
MDILIRNISALVQTTSGTESVSGVKLGETPSISNAFLYIRGGLIHSFGPDEQAPSVSCQVIDATGRLVLPGFIDCHTHLIFPSSRENEFVMKIKGASYTDIAAAGGGILNSAAALKRMSEEELFEKSLVRLKEIIKSGTVAVEVKSGYGLDTEQEIKMLRVARRLGSEGGIPLKTTFLGAHAVPAGISKSDYLTLLKTEMIPAVAADNLADFIDVFCEQGFFNPDESLDILTTGKNYGMTPRIHANQLGRSGGVQTAVKAGAVSADHLEQIESEEIELLKSSSVMPVALPGAAFFLRLPYTPAREIIRQGLPIAIASDYNPGSSPSGNMMFMWSLACIGMRMTPEEALNAMTINPAVVLGLEQDYGSIHPGK